MKKFNILFVGGTFDEEIHDSDNYPTGYSGNYSIDNKEQSIEKLSTRLSFGRSSGLVTKIINSLVPYANHMFFVNGGKYSDLANILNNAMHYDIVFWWANVANDLPKVRDVKEVAPRVMLVTSKRNDNEKYKFNELINRALGTKSNLCIEFSKNNDGQFKMMLFDPLGNNWYQGYDINECVDAMMTRLAFLSSITRQGCTAVPGNVEVPNDENFFELIKNKAEIFHELIAPAPNVTRFLGNSSFRCQRGFPSFRDDKLIYVSRRNVDKRYIDRNAFVPTYLENNRINYLGDNKPSVDTPIQLRLYNKLPNIRYMMHAHVYIKDAPYTEHMIPCGGLEEVDEVINAIMKHYNSLNENFYVLNLIGHGSIVMSSDVEKMLNVPYIGRVVPEKLN